MSDSEDSEVAEAWIDEVTEAVDALEQWRDETNMRLDNIEARMGLFPQNIPNNNLPGAGGGKRKRKYRSEFFNLNNFLFYVIYLSNKPHEGTAANDRTAGARADQSQGEKLRCDIRKTHYIKL